MNGNCYSADGVNPTLTTNKGEGNKIAISVDCISRNYMAMKGTVRTYEEETPTLNARDYKYPLCAGIPVVVPDDGITAAKCLKGDEEQQENE